MLDHILGRPSTRLKRAQVLCVLTMGLLSLAYGDRDGPRRMHWLRWLNRHAKAFTPWQIVVATVTAVYAIRNLDHLLGFGAPEPLARMYSRSFYRTTWINTALDAGFATAMPIRPQWLKDILALLFSAYYLVYANEADEKLRKYRAFCTVEMMRETWHKTTNPYIRLATWIHRPALKIAKEVLLPRPSVGKHASRPTVAWLFFDGDERALRSQSELILDIPGGGFISMDPRHHEERLRALAKQTGRPVLALNYCKAPEFPFPFALEECYDAYRTLYETRGAVIGMGRQTLSGPAESPSSSSALEKAFRIILSGDSAGGNLATGVMMKIIEYPQPHIEVAYAELSSRKAIERAPDGTNHSPARKPHHSAPVKSPPLPKPIAILLAYPALNFAYSSWMKPEHIRVLRQQSEVNLQTMRQQSETSAAAARANQAAAAAAAAATLGGPNSALAHPSSPLNPNRSGRRPSLNTRVGLPSSLEEERRQQLRNAGIVPSTGRGQPQGTGASKEAIRASRVSSRKERPLGLVPPPGVPAIVTSPTAILNSFMDKAQSVIRRSASRGSIDISGLTPTKMDATAASGPDANGRASSKQRPAAPKRERSYSSLAGQAQMHLVERARFAEAEPSASEDEAAAAASSYTIGSFGDEDDNQDGAAADALQEAQRQYHQRVMTLTASKMDPADAEAALQGGGASVDDVDGTSSGYNTDHENRAHEEQQRALRAAADAADARMASARAKRGQRAYGTRLTMTSMAGYFQDRILTQSMMRAMAILYIGPKYQPDFENDYYLSPIVAPAALLAEFPPCLFVCGEKDPICDDTVVMAGRIREAKTAKKRNLERRRAGPSARFGEGLRMSTANSPSASAAAEARDPIEDESPEDWVQMRIIEGWSHGFLQMSALMPEAKEVIKFLGVWMWETFEDWNMRNGVVTAPVGAAGAALVQLQDEAPSTSSSQVPGHMPPPTKDAARLAAMRRRSSEGDDDDDEPLSFTTAKDAARRSPVTGSSTPQPQSKAQSSPFTGSVPAFGASVAGSADARARAALLRSSSAERSLSPMSRAPVHSPAPAGTAVGSLSTSSNGPAVPTTRPIPPGNGSASVPGTTLAAGASMPATTAASGTTAVPIGQSSAATAQLAPVPAPTATSQGLFPSNSPPNAGRTAVAQVQKQDERARRGSGSSANGSGGGGGAGLDEKYKSMLVQESQLLQRRRGEAVFGLVDSGAVHDGSDDEHEHEHEAEAEAEHEGDE